VAHTIHIHKPSPPLSEADEKRIGQILSILARCPIRTPLETLKRLIKPFVEEWRIISIIEFLYEEDIIYYDKAEKVCHVQDAYQADYLVKPIPKFLPQDGYHKWLQDFALALSDLGEYHHAIEILEGFRSLIPAYHRQLNHQIGQLYFIIGEYTKTISLIQPTNYSQLGLVNLYSGKIQEAYSYFLQQENATASSDRTNFEANLGLYAHIRGDIQQAIQHFNIQIRLAHNQSDNQTELIGLANLGKAYINISDYVNAIATLEQALEMTIPIRYSKSVILEYLATAYLFSGNTDQAQIILNQGKMLGYRHSAYNMHILTGILLHQSGEATAKEEFEDAIRLLDRSQSENFEKLYRLGLAHAGLGLYIRSHLKKAVGYYQDAIKQCNGQGVIRYELGLLSLLSSPDQLSAIYKVLNASLE